LAKATWNYSSSFVFTVDLLLQLVAEAMLDADIGHLLGEDPERRPDAIVRIVIEKIGHEDFKECIQRSNTTYESDSAIRFMMECMLIDAATENTRADPSVVPDIVVAKMEQ
jgi:hypothetical protein